MKKIIKFLKFILPYIAITVSVATGVVIGKTIISSKPNNIQDNEKYQIKKPVIYLYPKTETNFDINLDVDGDLKYTYPKLENSWKGIAYPDGTLKINNRTYPYLFWESVNYTNFDTTKGFIVKGEDTISFLEEKLSILGLNEKEQTDFITYWLPEMQDNPYNYIYFAGEDYTNQAKLTIAPTPDSLIRVFMVFEALQEPVDIPIQELTPVERKGFTVVEWGGTEWK